jgi:hypothetical protein
MTVVHDAIGLSIWPREKASLSLRLFAFDVVGQPTAGAWQFTVTRGAGALTTRQEPINEAGVLAVADWKLDTAAPINAVRVLLEPSLDSTLALETVLAASPPAIPTKYVLDSLDGNKPPFSFEGDDYYKTYVHAIEVELHRNRYVLTHLLQHPLRTVQTLTRQTGIVEWANGIGVLQPDTPFYSPADNPYDAIAVIARDGRLQIANRSGNVWPPIGRRYDFTLAR